MGARDEQTLKAFAEAEAYEGTSIIVAYSHCIAHGINMETGMQNQKAVVDSGQWMLYRFNPALSSEGKNPLQLDSKKPKMPVEDFLMMETRFKMLFKINPERAKQSGEHFRKAGVTAKRTRKSSRTVKTTRTGSSMSSAARQTASMNAERSASSTSCVKSSSS